LPVSSFFDPNGHFIAGKGTSEEWRLEQRELDETGLEGRELRWIEEEKKKLGESALERTESLSGKGSERACGRRTRDEIESSALDPLSC
jgi:hypothetical protein